MSFMTWMTPMHAARRTRNIRWYCLQKCVGLKSLYNSLNRANFNDVLFFKIVIMIGDNAKRIHHKTPTQAHRVESRCSNTFGNDKITS